MNMKITQIIFALMVIGSHSVLAEMPGGAAMNIEELAINTSFEASEAGSAGTMKGQYTFESEADEDAPSRQEELPATINKVASDLQSKLDQRMKTNFERRLTVHPTFAIAY
jgi:hypothetical protein